MEAWVTSYRRGKNTSYDNQVILEIEGVGSKEQAKEHVGKKITYKTGKNKKIKGKITSPHGNSGAMRVRFKKGVPGKMIGSKVQIGE